MNQITLIGNIGNIDSATLPSGNVVATVSLATTERWRDRQTNEKREATEWHRCVCWGPVAALVINYASIGRKLMVQGRVQTRKWTDDAGVDRWTTEVIVKNLEFLDARPKNDEVVTESEAESVIESAY